MEARFRMRKEPAKPVRSSVHFSHYLEDGSLLHNIGGLVGVIRAHYLADYDWVNEAVLIKMLDKIHLEDGSGDYYSSTNAICIGLPESDRAFNVRLKEYETRFADYQAWYKQNKAEVEAYKKKEKEKKREAEESKRKKAAAQILKDKVRLEKLLESTKTKLARLEPKGE